MDEQSIKSAGIEDQGVMFTIGIKDETTHQAGLIERSYEAVVRTMQSAASKVNDYGTMIFNSVKKVRQVINEDRMIGFNTPMTTTPKQLELFDHYEVKNTRWFTNTKTRMLDLINMMKRHSFAASEATQNTEGFFNSLHRAKLELTAGLIDTAAVHKFRQVEDAANGMAMKLGESRREMAQYRTELTRMALQNKMDIDDLETMGALLADQNIKFDERGRLLALANEKFVEVTDAMGGANRVSRETAAEFAGLAQNFFKLGQDTEGMYSAMIKASTGSRLSTNEAIQGIIGMKKEYREAMQGMESDTERHDFSKKIIPQVISAQKTIADNFGNPAIVQKWFQGLTDVTSTAGQQLRILLGDDQYWGAVRRLKNGEINQAFDTIKDRLQAVNQEGFRGIATFNQYAQAIQMDPDELRSIAEIKGSFTENSKSITEASKSADELNKRFEQSRSTFSGLYRQLKTLGEAFLVYIGEPIAKVISPAIGWMVEGFSWFASSGAGRVLGWIIGAYTGFKTLGMGLRALRFAWKLSGIKDLVLWTRKIPGAARAAGGALGELGSKATAAGSGLARLAPTLGMVSAYLGGIVASIGMAYEGWQLGKKTDPRKDFWKKTLIETAAADPVGMWFGIPGMISMYRDGINQQSQVTPVPANQQFRMPPTNLRTPTPQNKTQVVQLDQEAMTKLLQGIHDTNAQMLEYEKNNRNRPQFSPMTGMTAAFEN